MVTGALVLLAGLRLAGFAAPWRPSPKCQAAADASCVVPCYDEIKARPCDGPMVARESTAAHGAPPEWRCYSPSTLTKDLRNYTNGTCYCSMDAPIRKTLRDCGDPAPPAPSPPPPPPHAPALPHIVPLPVGTGGYSCFRIPSLLVLPGGRRLLFAEGRQTGCGDHGFVDVVLKASSDGGLSWGPLRKLYGESTPAKPVTIGNPSPVIDARHPGHIVLTCNRENKAVLVLRSTDSGQ